MQVRADCWSPESDFGFQQWWNAVKHSQALHALGLREVLELTWRDALKTKQMVVMPANQSGRLVKFLAQRYPGRIGHLYSPGGQRGPYPNIPYALDNGCFKRWEPAEFKRLLRWAEGNSKPPAWVVVPDAMGQPNVTLKRWAAWARTVRRSGFPIAIAVQDGMTPDTVLALDEQPDVVFIGGSTDWKWSTVELWASTFPRVHVGRVNAPRRLQYLEDIGVESCDGTGWFRGDKRQLAGMVSYLRKTPQMQYWCKTWEM